MRFKAPEMVKMAISDFINLLKLISRKILKAEKFLNFHAVGKKVTHIIVV